ncbi:hypothetical protein [Streptomyces sp. NPDC050982]|uniref:hypothetical protein n=1 Tax=Streptomyces sp. NPDC050982 TaxID=3154746 RepID=UPI0033FDF76B
MTPSPEDDFDTGRWAVPKRIGYIAASEFTHFVAAPLLAGSSIAVVGVIIADGDKLRWPGPATFSLTLCAIFFISSIQRSFNARANLFSAADVDAWFGTTGRPPEAVLKQFQRAGFQKWRSAVDGATNSYNLGVVMLGVGASLALAPPQNSGVVHASFRWAACSVAGLAAVSELLSAIRIWRRSRSGAN